MECFFINLDSQISRRIALEENFSRYAQSGWSLTRFPAVTVDDVHEAGFQGRITPPEKACFVSHKNLIKRLLGSDNPVMILEDDAIFGSHTCEAVNGILEQAHAVEWDIIFTDICVPGISTMVELIRLRHQFESNGKVQLLNLAHMAFAGATAYILSGKSKRKIYQLIEKSRSLDIPYDLFLRKYIYDNTIRSFCIFPFTTSLSEYSEISQIQTDPTKSPDLIWNTFRKMIWLDRHLDDVEKILNKIDQELCDPESRLFGVLFSASASSRYRPK